MFPSRFMKSKPISELISGLFFRRFYLTITVDAL